MAEGPGGTRPLAPVITGSALSAVWPEVSHRLAKLLTSRGAAPDVVDDVVQEVAARVLAKNVTFDDAMDLMRWAVPVALNLLVDNARYCQRVTAVPEDHDQPVADVADLVAHRDRLRRVLRALPQLSAADRAALTGQDAPSDRKEAVRLAVRRHRARRRLLALVDGVAAFAAFVVALAKRSGRVGVATTVAVAAAPVALLLTPGTPAPPARMPATELAVEFERPVRAPRATVSRATAPRAARKERAATAPAPARPRTAAPRPRTGVRVDSPAAKVAVREKKKDEPVVCIRRAGPVEAVCVPDKVGVGNDL